MARDLERWERAQQSGGREDSRGAIITVQAGAGGQDSQDWVETLTGMYAGWAQAHGRSCPALSIHHAPGGGLRNAVLEIGGEGAYALPARGPHPQGGRPSVQRDICQSAAPLGDIPHLAVPAVNSDALQGIQMGGNDAPVHQRNLVVLLHPDVILAV